MPVELPSGPTLHLSLDELHVDFNSYLMTLYTIINDPKEQRFFSENPEILGIMGQSIQEKWGFPNFEFKLYVPPDPSLLPSGGCISALAVLDLTFPIDGESLTLNSANSLGGTIFTQQVKPSLNTMGWSGSLTLDGSNIVPLPEHSNAICVVGTFTTESSPLQLTNGPIVLAGISDQALQTSALSSNVEKAEEKNTSSETSLAISSKDLNVKDNPAPEAAPIVKLEEVNTIESSQDETKKGPIFELTFKTVGNDFGGGWRLIPYDLRFIKKQVKFGDMVEGMALVLTPDRSELYQKKYDSPIFLLLKKTEKSLIGNPDNTFTLSVPSREKFLFNNRGELMQSLTSVGEISAYEYFNGQLAAIHHQNHPTLSFEYEGKNVVSINGLSNKIHFEYDKHGLLCRIFDQRCMSRYLISGF